MKDAKGHGSNPRGGATGKNSPDEERLFNNLMAKTAQGGEEKNFAALMQRATNPASDAQAASQLGQGHPKSGAVPVHGGASGGLARGLSVDWSRAPNPYTGGGFAAQSRARRKDRAAAYVTARAARPSNFKLR